MEIKIATLSENTADAGGYLAEWGLSMLIQADGVKVLFDTGTGFAALPNARQMRTDLRDIDAIVISHGHYDHTGGLLDVLKTVGRKIDIFAHPDIWADKYSRRNRRSRGYAGVPYRREALESLGARFHLSRTPFSLSAHIMTSGEIPMVTAYEEVDEALFQKKQGRMLPDELQDDLALVIDTDFGLVVILGCAHRGIINTLKHACKITGKDLIYAAIGGTHLLHASPERIKNTVADLKELGVQYLGVSHCTGFAASAYLAQEFGARFFLNNSGSRLILPFKEKR